MTREIELVLPLPPTVNHYWLDRVFWPKGCAPRKVRIDEGLDVKGGTRVRGVEVMCYPANVKPRVVKIVSDDGTEFRWKVRAALARAGALWYSQQQVEISMQFCFRDRRVQDVDNRVKPLLDALQAGGFVVNDAQFWPQHTDRGPIGNPRVIVRAREIADMQLALGVA